MRTAKRMLVNFRGAELSSGLTELGNDESRAIWRSRNQLYS
jgi:hypothetical protein